MNILTTSCEKEGSLKEVSVLQQEMVSFFARVHKLHINLSEGDSRKFLLSFVGDISDPQELAAFLQLFRSHFGGIRRIPHEISLPLYQDIFHEMEKRRHAFRNSFSWTPKYIAAIVHHLRDVTTIPQFFIEDIQSFIDKTQEQWCAHYIIEVLRFSEYYRDTEHGKRLIQTVGEKIFGLNIESLSFRSTQKLVIELEHTDVNIPIELLNRWNILQNEEAEKHFTPTQDEENIVASILGSADIFDGFTIGRNEYICGYEVDIVLHDTEGRIFAIIESDGSGHMMNSNTRNKDNRRDALFLRRGVTDTIIRCQNLTTELRGNSQPTKSNISHIEIVPMSKEDIIGDILVELDRLNIYVRTERIQGLDRFSEFLNEVLRGEILFHSEKFQGLSRYLHGLKGNGKQGRGVKRNTIYKEIEEFMSEYS